MCQRSDVSVLQCAPSIVAVARTHHDVVAECDELPGQRLPNHAGAQDADLHDRTSYSDVANASRSRMGSTLKRSRNSKSSLGKNVFILSVTASASASS
jgi:hypothetical protein